MVDVIIGSIGVTAPYYALKDLTISNDEVSAEFAAEQPKNNEVGGIAAAEVGRHLAVLGACALAWSNPVKKKHYYIAASAELRNISENSAIGNGKYIGVGKTLDIDKRSGSVSATLFAPDKTPLYTLVTQYFIMSEPLFKKMFNAKKQDTPDDPFINPYSREFSLRDIHYADNVMEARLGPFEPEECSGHFSSYPCIPVAILMHGLSRAAGMLLARVVDGDSSTYKVVSADVKAEAFAFAGESVHMVVRYTGRERDDYVFSCSAGSIDGRQYGSMMLKLACTGNP